MYEPPDHLHARLATPPCSSPQAGHPPQRAPSAGGAGIGLSDHKSQFSNGVLSGDNWVEEKFAVENNNPPPMWHGGGGARHSTMQASYVPEGKFGGQITANLDMAEDIKFQRRGVNKESLFGHYPAMADRTTSFVASSELHFAEPEKTKPRAQAGLWAPSYKHNLAVPTKSAHEFGSSMLLTKGKKTVFGSELTTAKIVRPSDAYRTTNDCTLGETGRQIFAGGTTKRGPLLADGSAEGGQRAQVGRKPVGLFNNAADARARRAQLRA